MLCSRSRTYAVKNVETTNLCLLVQEEPAAPAAAAAALTSQDPNVQPTPPGVLLGLGTQLEKVGGGRWGRVKGWQCCCCQLTVICKRWRFESCWPGAALLLLDFAARAGETSVLGPHGIGSSVLCVCRAHLPPTDASRAMQTPPALRTLPHCPPAEPGRSRTTACGGSSGGEQPPGAGGSWPLPAPARRAAAGEGACRSLMHCKRDAAGPCLQQLGALLQVPLATCSGYGRQHRGCGLRLHQSANVQHV